MPASSGKRRRSYTSDLRQAQAAETRRRILDCVSRLLATRTQRLSAAAIAREAGVSVPTVNRHFPTRQQLFEAFRLHVEGTRASDKRTPDAARPAAVAAGVREFFKRFDDPADPLATMRRLRASPAWEFSRTVTVPRRREWVAALCDARCPNASARDRQRLIDLLTVLVSASMAEAMGGYLGRTGKDTADRVNWAIDALIAYANRTADKERYDGSRAR